MQLSNFRRTYNLTKPRVSVVMPVYNREKFIESTIDSILNQTYKDFELIIVDDGSTDNTVEIIQKYSDPRIILIRHKENKGAAAARNTGYKHSRGEYIVVSDSDDINRNDKIQKQVEFLEKNPDIDIVGCVYRPFNSSGYLNDWTVYEDDSLIRAEMLFWPGTQTASMFRRKKILQYNCLYHDESFKAAIDYEWFNKIPKDVRFSNINEPLYFYRWHENQISTKHTKIQMKYVWILRERNLIKLGIDLADIDYTAHNIIAGYYKYDLKELMEIADFSKIIQWSEKLIETNRITKVYKESSLIQVINDKLKGLFQYLETNNVNKWIYWYRYKYNNITFPEFSHKFLKSIYGKNIAILGTKKMGLIIYALLLEDGYNIEYFVDNYYTGNYFIDNVEIVNESYLIQNSPEILIISVEGNHRFSIKEKYKSLIPSEIILIDELFE